MLIKSILAYLTLTKKVDISNYYTKEITGRLFNSISESSHQYISSRANGELVDLMSTQARKVVRGIEALAEMMALIILTLSYFVFALFISWQIVVLIIFCGLLFSYFTKFLRKKSRVYAEKISKTEVRISKEMNEMISGYELIKCSSNEK